jgi:hypothetical protein
MAAGELHYTPACGLDRSGSGIPLVDWKNGLRPFFGRWLGFGRKQVRLLPAAQGCVNKVRPVASAAAPVRRCVELGSLRRAGATQRTNRCRSARGLLGSSGCHVTRDDSKRAAAGNAVTARDAWVVGADAGAFRERKRMAGAAIAVGRYGKAESSSGWQRSPCSGSTLYSGCYSPLLYGHAIRHGRAWRWAGDYAAAIRIAAAML